MNIKNQTAEIFLILTMNNFHINCIPFMLVWSTMNFKTYPKYQVKEMYSSLMLIKNRPSTSKDTT